VLDHITIRVSDRAASERFYDTVLRTIGIERSGRDDDYTVWRGQFSLAQADADHPVTRRLQIGFASAGQAQSWIDPDGNSVEAVQRDDARGRVFDHLLIRVGDLAAAKRFYDTVAPFGGFSAGSEEFELVAGEPTENLHLAFEAISNETVDAFHRALIDAGYRDNGAPGPRHYHAGYYGAFVLDPDGNNVEVVNHNR